MPSGTQLNLLAAVRHFALRNLRGPVKAWLFVSQFLRGLLVAAVPTASVAIGLALYWNVPQAQDLFLEVVGGRLGGTLFWAMFYAVAILAWVIPVYISSRWILLRYNCLAEQPGRHTPLPIEPRVILRGPPALATLCLLAIFLGQWGGIMESPRTGDTCAAVVGGAKSDCTESIEKGRAFYKWLDTWKQPDQAKNANQKNTQPVSEAAKVVGMAAVGLAQSLFVVGVFLAWVLLGLSRVSAFLTTPFSASPQLSRFRLPARIVLWLGSAGLIVLALYLAPSLRLSIAQGLVLLSLPGWIFVGLVWADIQLASAVTTPQTILDNLHQNYGAPLCTPGNLIDYAYNSVGAPGFIVVILLLLASPAVIFGLWLAKRWCRNIGASGLRISLRLTLWLLLLLLLFIDYIGVKILLVSRSVIFEALHDRFSIYELMLLPLVTLALAVAVWLLLSRHNRRMLTMEVSLEKQSNTFGILMMISMAFIFAIIIVDPLKLSKYVYRAPLLPILLGLWIAPLTLLSLWSRRTRTPILLGLIALAAAVFPWISGDSDDIRVLRPETQAPNPSRPSLDESLERWAKVNNCPLAAADLPQNCPAPIIVLASGGASRAAFKAVEVLGDLIDRSEEIRASGNAPPGFRPFQQRVFAISGVSGGAFAAVTFQAALAEGQLRRRDTAALLPPCLKDRKSPLWFGNDPGHGASPDARWQECLQLLVSADFLSPAVLSLAGSDLLNIRFYGDRAAILEISWERHFESITGAGTMARTLLAVREQVLKDNERNWLPHLFLNGTSVSTGRRIITSDLDTRDLFNDAYDLHTLIRNPLSKPCLGCDIALSTGATMSARFPVLSPHGTIRDAEGKVVDRVVDGGYFENNGAVTALELVAALRERGLSPLILLITNEPTQAAMPCVDDHAPLELPKAKESTTLAVVASPINALLGTRAARGTLASVELCKMVKSKLVTSSGKIIPPGDFVHIGVPADSDILGVKQLSMSWWLSKYVQRKLANPGPNEATIKRLVLGLPPR